jgi:hypothetical protein
MNIVITFTAQRDQENGKAQCSIAAELDTLLEGEPSLEAVITRLRTAAAAALAQPDHARDIGTGAVVRGQTPEQAAALAAYRANLPQRTPAPGPAPRAAVVATVHAPAPCNEKPRRKGPRLDPLATRPAESKPGPTNDVPATPESVAPREWTGRRLFDDCKDVPERLNWYEAFGRARGFPRLMINWSPTMAAEARAARYSPDRPLPTDRRQPTARA